MKSLKTSDSMQIAPVTTLKRGILFMDHGEDQLRLNFTYPEIFTLDIWDPTRQDWFPVGMSGRTQHILIYYVAVGHSRSYIVEHVAPASQARFLDCEAEPGTLQLQKREGTFIVSNSCGIQAQLRLFQANGTGAMKKGTGVTQRSLNDLQGALMLQQMQADQVKCYWCTMLSYTVGFSIPLGGVSLNGDGGIKPVYDRLSGAAQDSRVFAPDKNASNPQQLEYKKLCILCAAGIPQDVIADMTVLTSEIWVTTIVYYALMMLLAACSVVAAYLARGHHYAFSVYRLFLCTIDGQNSADPDAAACKALVLCVDGQPRNHLYLNVEGGPGDAADQQLSRYKKMGFK
jgi:hypothetical protein